MTINMTCDRFADLLSAYLERDLDEAARAAMDTHAVQCHECRELLADLRDVQTRAASLPDLAPSRDLWAGIQARIETPVIDLGSGQHRAAKRGWMQHRWARPGIAAAALVLITAGVTHVMTRRAYAPTSSVASNDSIPPATVAAETAGFAPPAGVTSKNPKTAVGVKMTLAANKAQSAQQTYDQEIGRLRAIVEQRRTQLDTTTLKVIEHNLVVIDSAISQCKAALHRDPASRFLTESLNDALDTKIELLRTAAMLPPRIS